MKQEMTYDDEFTSNSSVICILTPSFEKIETELEEAGLKWYLD